MSTTNDNERYIVVTGFGLFRDHKSNPSWEAIRDGQLRIDRKGFKIVTQQVDVSYEDVDQTVALLWEKYNPILMVHVGLAAFESSIRIEQRARLGPYLHDDVRQCAPHKELRDYNIEGGGCLEEKVKRHNYTCKPCDFDFKNTGINVDRICDKMTEFYDKKQCLIPTKKSCDAGLYVCEYIYQKSLTICDQCLFIHVPSTEKFRLEDIRTSIAKVIEVALEELDQSSN